MAYDKRGFYYRSLRDGDRVRRVYFGRKPIGHLSSLMVEQRRVEAGGRARARRAGEAARAPAEAGQRALDDLADRVMRAALLAAGYHRHDRGAWRRRRMSGDDATVAGGTGIGGGGPAPPTGGGARPPTGPPPAGPDAPGDGAAAEVQLRELVDRAERGDRAVLPALRALLDRRPDLWRLCGDVARVAEAAWVDLLAGGNLMARESLSRKVAELKAELAGPGAPPLERLLAERVACCWMQAAQADAALAALKGGAASIGQLELMQRRQGRAQRAYLAAMKALATVRRLAVPAAPTAANLAFTPGRMAGPGSAREGCGRPEAGARPASQLAADDGRSREGGPGVAGARAADVEVVPRSPLDRLKGPVGSDDRAAGMRGRC